MKQKLYRKHYSIQEGYQIFVDGIRSLKDVKLAQKTGLISKGFIQRIMLAVTEVNGCEVCSYAHTKSALEMGMSEKEIHQMLTGQNEVYPKNESKAIFFAQHYADTKGAPSEVAWKTLIAHYGEDRALGILGAIRMIMVGNSYGLAVSALKSRFAGKRVKGSSLIYELSMILSLIITIPVGSLHALIRKQLNRPQLSFK